MFCSKSANKWILEREKKANPDEISSGIRVVKYCTGYELGYLLIGELKFTQGYSAFLAIQLIRVRLHAPILPILPKIFVY